VEITREIVTNPSIPRIDTSREDGAMMTAGGAPSIGMGIRVRPQAAIALFETSVFLCLTYSFGTPLL
jgi:hypothetical protein